MWIVANCGLHFDGKMMTWYIIDLVLRASYTQSGIPAAILISKLLEVILI